MIAVLRGRVASRAPTPAGDAVRVVVDVGGVGYLVVVPTGLAAQLPGMGEEAVVHTSLQVREDAMTLYGFPSAAARELFELLLTASGVGPRIALAALSTHAPQALHRAIAEGDEAALTLVPGVGRKGAQRMVLELRDRVDAAPAPPTSRDAPAAGALAEVRLALVELGYSPAEASRAVQPLDAGGEAGDLLRAALRNLAGAAG